MPQLGETVTEGTILKWSKQVGETISEDEVLVEISTDKVDTEVPSPVSGTILEILVEEGDTVEVGVALVVIGSADEAGFQSQTDRPAMTGAALSPDPASASVTAARPDPQTGPETRRDHDPGPEVSATEEGTASMPSDEEVEAFFAEPEKDSEPRLLSPLVRRLVRENQLDVSKVRGTGRGGRVTRQDVEAHMAGTTRPVEPFPHASPAETVPPPPVEPAPVRPESAETVADGEPEAVVESPSQTDREIVALDRRRVRIAGNNVNAKATAAHVWTSVEVDYERVERVRQANKAEFKANEGFSLTYLPFVARAAIDALKAYPVVNSSFDIEAKTATFFKKVDLGIAIDLSQQGLIVARIRNADGLGLVGIARDVRDLASRGRAGSLGIDDISGSTFTITNPGSFGSFMSAPIINLPNVAILSSDTVTKRPTVITTPEGQDMIAIRHIGYLGLSWDHRAFDGSTAVLFLRRVKENLETWDWEQELA